jgi:hypothetical protein
MGSGAVIDILIMFHKDWFRHSKVKGGGGGGIHKHTKTRTRTAT